MPPRQHRRIFTSRKKWMLEPAMRNAAIITPGIKRRRTMLQRTFFDVSLLMM